MDIASRLVALVWVREEAASQLTAVVGTLPMERATPGHCWQTAGPQ